MINVFDLLALEPAVSSHYSVVISSGHVFLEQDRKPVVSSQYFVVISSGHVFLEQDPPDLIVEIVDGFAYWSPSLA